MNRRIVLALLLAVGVTGGWWFGKACAPDFYTAVFSYKRHPDLPRSRFIDGRLGVLQPTFARSYLVIAYRYLNGISMNPGEREQARDYYKDRDTGKWDHSGTDWPAQWWEVRSHVQSPPAPPMLLITNGQLYYDPETHSFTLNCAEDAFRIAVHTLEARRTQFGSASRAFRSWVEAQDKVLENCGGGLEAIPSKASADLPAVIRADRDYQIAAAHFYAGNYEDALELFRRISHDQASPWNAISRYLVVRTLLRMMDDDGAGPSDSQLEAEAQSILSDSKLASIHGMTWNLVERAEIRQRDHTYFRELGRLLSSPGQDNGFREELWNYTDMYDGVIGKADPNAIFAPSKPVAADPARFRDVDLSDWVFCFQSRDSSVFSHSLERWKQTRSAAWLLAALEHASAATAGKEGLLRAATTVSESSPAFLTARFHIFRIYEQFGDRTAARDGLTQLLASPALKDLPSSANLFRGLRMLTAPTFEDFVQFAVRKPVMITSYLNMGEAPFFWGDASDPRFKATGERFDRDAARLLNRHTPFRLLKQAVLSDSLPAELRGEVLMTAFTRGLMLGEDLSDIARKIAANQPHLASLTDGYLRETTGEGGRFAAAFLLLRRPEARPYFASGVSRQTPPGKLDPYRDNWWCPMDIEFALDSRANVDNRYDTTPNILQRSTNDVMPEFVTAEIAAEANREFAKLGTMNAATDFLGGIVFQYAKTYSDDARIPEALHNLVRSGHFGCADVNTWKTAQAAFRMLHVRYPGNEWTKRTPTWVKNDLDIRRELKSRQGSDN